MEAVYQRNAKALLASLDDGDEPTHWMTSRAFWEEVEKTHIPRESQYSNVGPVPKQIYILAGLSAEVDEALTGNVAILMDRECENLGTIHA
jgi:hypothetical protein